MEKMPTPEVEVTKPERKRSEVELDFRRALKTLREQVTRPAEEDELSEVDQLFFEMWQNAEMQEMLGLSPEHLNQIREIQREKQRIMRWFLAEVKALGKTEREYPPNARRIAYADGAFDWIKSDGSRQPITLGMLMTDGIWDVEYALDESVPLKVRRRFLVEKTRRLLQRELDRQIAIHKQQSSKTNPRYKGGYKGLVKDREAPTQQGHMAERMVYSFLRKLTIDERLPFEIEAANVFEDIELSADFVVRVKMRRRGVKVEGTEDDQVIGIQFTIMSRKLKKAKKLEEARERARSSGSRMDDIVLVRVRLKRLIELFADWSRNKPPGGPDELWDAETKRTIVRGVLKDLFTPEEIDGMCGRIADRDPFAKAS